MRYLMVLAFVLLATPSFPSSNTFPQSQSVPIVADFLPEPNNIYYCAPDGDNSTGDGTIGNPWVDFIGAAGTVSAGDLIYLRGGTYPAYSYVNYSRSQNILSTDGTSENPIIITNYPGEIAQWSDTDIWSLTLDGDYQYLIGTDVGGNKGIKFTGGISFRADNVKIINCEFITGTSNAGDLNPAMVSQPLVDNAYENALISHNHFHDSRCINTSGNIGACSGTIKMSGIRLFTTDGTIIEYNVFENMETNDGGSVYFKDATQNATVRYNKFIDATDSEASISFFGQDQNRPSCNGLVIYGNLFYNVDSAFRYRNEYTPGLRIYDNVVLETPLIYYYLNSENETAGVDNGEVYNNVFEGLAFEVGWVNPGNSADERHLPNVWDYNLWSSSDDRNDPSEWILPTGYYDHAVTSADLGITYNATTQTATADDDYAGLGVGRYSDNIGGFVFSTPTLPTAPGISGAGINIQ